MVQLKSEAVDPDVGPLQIDDSGTIQFEWGRVTSREKNDLTLEFVTEAALRFEDVERYEFEQQLEAVEEEGDFDDPTLQIADLSEEEMGKLVDGVRTFLRQARELHDG
ncbi:hypothetical protein [Haloquadratum walsbyi]|jgi:hypothetical protein|nr:hypothetical protein [Haloquadratum walsbyi]